METTPLPPAPEPDYVALERLISGALIRLRTRAPFFGALALFARMQFRTEIPTAATDGRDVFWNPYFLTRLQPAEICGVLLHEVLHAALLHIARRGTRDPILWNIAADIVVNGMIVAESKRSAVTMSLSGSAWIALPEGTLRDPHLEKFSVEEVYELIEKDRRMLTLADEWRDLWEGTTAGPEARYSELTSHWRGAQAQAQTLLRASGRGDIAGNLLREFSALEPAQLDWRSRLWRFLVRTPTDFSGFDRRFVGRSLYLEALEGESLRVFVGIDTSGSIGDRELVPFLAEVQGILRSYPHLVCTLFYVDAAAYGPYYLTADVDPGTFPIPVGGGGTNFCPFFTAVDDILAGKGVSADFHNSAALSGAAETLCVYLTDGDGVFPDPVPPYHTLWVVSAGGLRLEEFPFGETVRLV